ncbi:toprim domain-containing protein [Alkalibacillus sp. S2W]|uniref:toprim domain-containing protein n=1 Tax=Alkalibacillus sp. S2W TaxID=3386553 RepID=UPI00398D39EA
MESLSRLIIVEGKQDRYKLKRVLEQEEDILCTFGTIGVYALDELIENYDLLDREVYIFTDEDEPGRKLRKQLNQELSHAENLFTETQYRQVEDTPEHVVASILQAANFKVKVKYLKGS